MGGGCRGSSDGAYIGKRPEVGGAYIGRVGDRL